MNIIEHKQYSFRQQPFAKLLGFCVGLVDNNPAQLSFYSQKLEQGNLDVLKFLSLHDLHAGIWGKDLHAIVYSPTLPASASELSMLRKTIENFPHIPIVTISTSMQENELNAMMKLGIRLHINRSLSRPRDLLIALEQILVRN